MDEQFGQKNADALAQLYIELGLMRLVPNGTSPAITNGKITFVKTDDYKRIEETFGNEGESAIVILLTSLWIDGVLSEEAREHILSGTTVH